MAGLFGMGGSASKTDRKQELKSWGDLSSLTDQSSKIGTQEVAAGQKATGKGEDFFSSLLSNDPGKVASAIAPQVNAVTGQEQQQRQQMAQFGNRGGGTNAASQHLGIDASSQITNLINTLLHQAATQESNIGLQREGLGLQSLSNASSTAGNLGTLTEGARQADKESEAAMGGGIASLVGAGLDFFTGGMGGSLLTNLIPK